MDARTLSRVTGVQAGTINAWVQRGYVSGMDVEVSGRRRDFDLKTAIYIGIMAELMQFGFGAPSAATAAHLAMADDRPCFLISNARQAGLVGKARQFEFNFGHFESEAQLPEFLSKERESFPDKALPAVYLVIHIQRIAARMQQAEEEWRQSQKTRRSRGADVR